VHSDRAEGGAAEGGSNGRDCSCRPGRSQLRSRKRAFRERAAQARRAVEAQLSGERPASAVTAGTEPVTAGAGVTAPGHGGHGAGHGASHGLHGAGHSDHGDGELAAGPVSAAASAAGAAALTIPFPGLEVENTHTP
jgi:hypothetical protein